MDNEQVPKSPTPRGKLKLQPGSPQWSSRSKSPKKAPPDIDPSDLDFLNILVDLNNASPHSNGPSLAISPNIGSPQLPPLSPAKGVAANLRNVPVDGAGLEIEEGTPAAEALRANADVKVTKVGKVARYLQVQAVRKTAKNILHVGSGTKRGKPPRVPDHHDEFLNDQQQSVPGVISTSGIAGDQIDSGDFKNQPLDVLLESDNEEDEDDGPSDGPQFELPDLSPHSQSQAKSPKGAPYQGELKKVGDQFDPDSSPVLLAKSSDSSDAHVPTKIASPDKAQKLTLLDTKGKRREVRLDRKMKKKLKKREKKNTKRNYVKGKVIDGHHELYTLSIAMMLGLRYSIFLTNNQILEDKKNDRMWLDSDEFMKVEKYIFRPDGRNNTPPHQLSHTFKFKDYSPLPFAFLRRMFGINEYEFHHSVCGNANFIEFISNAKSGQFFFYSSDGRYMIKTMTNQESKFLRRILPHYFRHCAQNPNTILTKFLGMYRVKLYHLRKNVKFVIMNSVFDTDKVLSSFYDLKGSVKGRDAKPGESVLKDNDLRKHMAGTIRLPSEVRERLREQVRRDCQFLKEMKIMDYSMLVGIHFIPSKSEKKKDINGLVFRGSMSKPKPLERSRSDPTDPLSNTSAMFQRPISATSERGHLRSRSTDFLSNCCNPKEDSSNFAPDNSFQYPSYKTSLSTPDLLARPLSPNSLGDDNRKIVAMSSERSVASAGSAVYEEDDEISLLGKIGCNFRSIDPKLINQSTYDAASSEFVKEREAIEKRRELAIEQNYWPFHRNYELNGDRRVIPMKSETVKLEQESVNDNIADTVCAKSCLGDLTANDPDLNALRENLTLDDFVAPISSRRDGGLMMDTKDVFLPLKVKTGGKTLRCDGKIYYMGIIDILQQFNTRKRLEARYRKITGGEIGASCVHPEVYADRFVEFFDEYTLASDIRVPRGSEHDDGLEEVVFQSSSLRP